MADEIIVPLAVDTPQGRLEVELRTTAEGISPTALLPAAFSLGDALVTRAREHAASQGTPVSCRRGCAACCYHPVPVSLAEAHGLAALVDAHPEREAIEARFDAALAALERAGMLEQVRAGEIDPRRYFALEVACPFLVDDLCSIYDDRPAVCREHLVTSSPSYCATQRKGKVRPMAVLGRVSRALEEVSRHVWPEDPGPYALVVALEVSRARAVGRGRRRQGIELLKRLIDAV